MLLVAGAGFDDSINDIVNKLKGDEQIQRDSVSFANIEDALKRCASGIKSTILLAGVKVRAEQPARLLRITKSEGQIRVIPFSSAPGNCCTFTGTEVAESMCKEIAEWLYSAGLPIMSVKALAVHLLTRVTSYASFCGPPIQTNYLFDTERPELAEMRRDIRLPEYTNCYLCGPQHDFGHTLRCCIDLSISDAMFEESLQRLIDTLRTARRAALTP
jgi:hypothetical protein